MSVFPRIFAGWLRSAPNKLRAKCARIFCIFSVLFAFFCDFFATFLIFPGVFLRISAVFPCDLKGNKKNIEDGVFGFFRQSTANRSSHGDLAASSCSLR